MSKLKFSDEWSKLEFPLSLHGVFASCECACFFVSLHSVVFAWELSLHDFACMLNCPKVS